MRTAIAIALVSVTAHAEPLALRADAFATSAAPAGLLTLDANGTAAPGVSAEAVVWMGGGGDPGTSAPGDVLVVALRGRTATNSASGTLGRFVETLGALRPVHVDGAAGRVRLPNQVDLEAFAGMPVVADLTNMGQRAWDWVAGGRASRRLGDWGSVGVAYLQQRDDGRLGTEEVGLDAGAAWSKNDDAGGKLAYDLVNPGLAEATLTASHRMGALRSEVYATYISASHILPATSLFSVLGDTPAERFGTTMRWRAAPRLDVTGDVGVRYAAGSTAPEIAARARLALDEKGRSALTGELRRDGVGMDQWTGAHGAALIALPYALAFTTELELVVPDHPQGMGVVWPWGLTALSWHSGDWDAAIALEASASPQDRRRVDVLANVGRRWGK